MVSGRGRSWASGAPTACRQSMEAGTTGLTFGRNIWQREHGESLRFITRLRDILAKHRASWRV